MELDKEVVVLLLDKLVIPFVVLVLFPPIYKLLMRLVNAAVDKLDIEWTAKEYAIVDEIIKDAIFFVEEQARKKVRGQPSDLKDTLSSPVKMEMAIDYVRRRGQELGLDDLAHKKSEDLTELIEAKLQTKRLKTETPGGAPSAPPQDQKALPSETYQQDQDPAGPKETAEL
jgi:hypothetical protein